MNEQEGLRKESPDLDNTRKTSYKRSHFMDTIPGCLEEFDVHTIIEKYGKQPDLLELILSCKAQEDKRKTEEAKLKQRELDYLISNEDMNHIHTHQEDNSFINERFRKRENSAPSFLQAGAINSNRRRSYNSKGKERQDNSPIRRYSPKDNSPLAHYNTVDEDYFSYSTKQHSPHIHRLSPSGISASHNQLLSPSSLPSLRSPLLKNNSMRNFQNTYEKDISHTRHRRVSETYLYNNNRSESNMLPPIQFSKASTNDTQIDLSPGRRYDKLEPSQHSPQHFQFDKLKNIERQSIDKRYNVEHSVTPESRSDTFINKRKESMENLSTPIENTQDQQPSSGDNTQKKLLIPINRSVKYATDKPRRRRKEMQPISMVIETKEFPYNDNYVWKNNGNTIHKSSGQKSIYYKCSNSNLGCTVNKTVTFKGDDDYLIKYRGNHLEQCNKIKKIVNTCCDIPT